MKASRPMKSRGDIPKTLISKDSFQGFEEQTRIVGAARALTLLKKAVKDLLSKKTVRASRYALRSIHESMDRMLQSSPTHSDLACRRGCSYCCSLAVAAEPVEIFALVETIRKRDDAERVVAAIHRADSKTRGLSPEARWKLNVKCPLLDETGSCSVYGQRPLACRKYASTSLEACATSNEAKVPFVHEVINGLHSAIYLDALKRHIKHHFVVDAYEMNEALCRVVDDPDAERRWLEGEDVFAGVQTSDGPQPLNPTQLEHLPLAGPTFEMER